MLGETTGVLSCFDRIVIQGTLPGLCHTDGMTGYLYAHEIRIFDYPRFAEPFRDELRENAEQLATENGIEIEFVRNHETQKERPGKRSAARGGTIQSREP